MALSDLGMTENDAQYILCSLLHSFILEIMVYGMYTAMSCIAMYLILTRGAGRTQLHAVVLIISLWLLSSIRIIVRWILVDDAFIRHAESRDTQMAATMVRLYALGVISTIGSFLYVLFADVTMVWRCYRLYGGRRTVIIVPILSLSVGTVAYILKAVAQFSPEGVRTPVAQSEATWKIVFLSTTVFTNVFCTGAIIFRILRVTGLTKSLKTYQGILEIVIESAILYTLIYLIYIGLDVYTIYFTDEWDVRYYYPESLAHVITGVAPTLIIARVVAGHSRLDDSWVHTSKILPDMRSTVQSSAESLHIRRDYACAGSDTNVDIERSAAGSTPSVTC